MEKEVKVSGKDFEAKCKGCLSLLAFNRQISGDKDTVIVTCGLLYTDCDLAFPKKRVK